MAALHREMHRHRSVPKREEGVRALIASGIPSCPAPLLLRRHLPPSFLPDRGGDVFQPNGSIIIPTDQVLLPSFPPSFSRLSLRSGSEGTKPIFLTVGSWTEPSSPSPVGSLAQGF